MTHKGWHAIKQKLKQKPAGVIYMYNVGVCAVHVIICSGLKQKASGHIRY